MHSWAFFIKDNRLSGLVRELEEAIMESDCPEALSSLASALRRGLANQATQRCRDLGFPTGSTAMAEYLKKRRDI